MRTPPIPSMRKLRGKVLLIFLEILLPELPERNVLYKNHSLVVLGIHVPKFGFEKKYRNFLQAVKKHKIKFLVV